jgi:hypothetical protein
MTEFFVARPQDLVGVDFEEAIPSALFPTIQAGGLWHVNIAELETIVTGVPTSKLLKKNFEPRGGFVWESDSDDDAVVTAFSARLVESLAVLDSAGCKRAGTRWAKTLGEPKIFIELVGDLRLLALLTARVNRWAVPGKRGAPGRWNVYLWSSL